MAGSKGTGVLALGLLVVAVGGMCGLAAGQPASSSGAGSMGPDSPGRPILINRTLFFPIGLYRYPKHEPGQDIFRSLADEGFNLYLLPTTATKEELDAAHRNRVKVMLVIGRLLDLSDDPEQVASKKKTLAERIGPGSVAFDHPAVVALEGPDEVLWNTRYKPGQAGALSPELATWVRPPAERQRVYALLKGLRDGYEEIHRLCGDRYQVWLNFAPRGDEQELRWFTGLPVVGGFEQDGRTTADVFGTDVYPIPDGRGNNGWIRGRLVPSAAAVGAFTDKLRRAVHPHPFYMVLHGCGILEWSPEAAEAGRSLRRPTFAELQFMAFDAIVHGASGILYWGANYINDDSLYWRHIGRVNRQVRALSQVLSQREYWPDARSGRQEVCVLGKIHHGATAFSQRGPATPWKEHYVLATNNHASATLPGWIAVPGWKGDKAYSLLDGRTVPVVDEVIRDTMPPLSARVYTDGTSLFEGFGRPRSRAFPRRPMRTLFGLPVDKEPFKDKWQHEITMILQEAGVDGVVKMPHDSHLVNEMKGAGIKAYAEISCFSGKKAWETFPGSRPITASGEPFDTEGGYGGVCVNHEGYVADLLSRIEHLLDEARWDGLWLDFIRWPGRWEEKEPKLTEVCFCDTCLARFAEDRGVHYPKELSGTAAKAAWILAERRSQWIEWKCDCVTDVVARIRVIMQRKLDPDEPDAILGIFGVPMRQADFDGAIHRTFGQDWAKLGPYVDVFSPMVYHIYCHRPLEWISQVVAEVSQRSGRTVWPIVQSCSMPTEM